MKSGGKANNIKMGNANTVKYTRTPDKNFFKDMYEQQKMNKLSSQRHKRP